MPLDIDSNLRPRGVSLSGNSIAALALLRQEAFPTLISAPHFTLSARAIPVPPGWLGRLLDRLARQAALAATIAALVLLLAVTIPVWSAMQSAASTGGSSSVTVRSSAGVTGTASTRVEDLGATTFLGGVPFVQQLRYYDAVTGSSPASRLFVQGALEGSLIQYIQSVGTEATFSYLNGALSTKSDIERYAAAIAENERLAAAPQVGAGGGNFSLAWQAPPIGSGTHIAGASVTFYACIGNGFCGNMSTGQQVFAGAAACSSDLPFGTRFTITNDPTGRVFTCLDRGALAPTWVDIWFYDSADGWAWQSLVGTRSDIIIQ